MSDDSKNPLAKWLTKAKTIPAPPLPTERRGRTTAGRKRQVFRQLNLKVSDSAYERIKGLAYRDRLSLVAMLDQMLDLYEKERGALEK
jgi:hypothetical protein